VQTTAIKWNPHKSDEHRIATASSSGVVIIWNLHGDDHLVLREHSVSVQSLAWHPSEPHSLISGSQDGHIVLWDLRRAGKWRRLLAMFNRWPVCLIAYLPACLAACLPPCPPVASQPTYLPVCAYLPICLPIYLPVYLPCCLPALLPTCLSANSIPPACLFVCLLVCIPTYLPPACYGACSDTQPPYFIVAQALFYRMCSAKRAGAAIGDGLS
jgi:hypothetical protein